MIDPDNVDHRSLVHEIKLSVIAKVDYFFIGGSLVVSNFLEECVLIIKKMCDIPVVLFPGSPLHLSKHADALLYLSLISGRNAEFLISQHVLSAHYVKESGLETISTGYMLVDGGSPTTVSYISNSVPIPSDKKEIAMCTAMAGEMLGAQLIFIDAGSGAKVPVSESMIETVSLNISVPSIVGGGICDPQKAMLNCKAGADVIVVASAIEKDVQLLMAMSDAVHTVVSPLCK